MGAGMCCNERQVPVDHPAKPEMPIVDSKAAVWPPLTGRGELEEEEVPMRIGPEEPLCGTASSPLSLPPAAAAAHGGAARGSAAVRGSAAANEASEEVWTATPGTPDNRVGYEVCIEKDGQCASSVGVRLDLNDGVRLQVVRVLEDGLVAKYNKVAAADRQIRVCDFVAEVNGVSGDAKAMVSKFVQETILSLWVVPAVDFVVKLRNQGSLGVTLFHDTESISMLVTDIGEGPVADHNRAAGPAEQIRLLDRIASVDGTTGKAAQLTAALNAALARHAEVELRILRPKS